MKSMRGFTLLEMLVALLGLGGAFGALLSTSSPKVDAHQAPADRDVSVQAPSGRF